MHTPRPHHPLPSFAYTPGVDAAHDAAALAPVLALVPARFDGGVLSDHPALRYGLALNDAGFFWESHEILEAVWKAAPQGGRDRILLRACIQIANVNLKLRMNRPRAVTRLLTDALADLEEIGRRAAGTDPGAFAAQFQSGELIRELRCRLVSGAAAPDVLLNNPLKLHYCS